MAKLDRPLMRQKINVSSALLKKWKFDYHFHVRNIINPSLLKSKDFGTTFEHQGRVFEIIGMGESDSIMLRETRDEGIFYWECTKSFVQFKLGRFNKSYQKLPNGKTILVDIPYEENQLFLHLKERKSTKNHDEDENELESMNEQYDHENQEID